jgi:hypothetical protein
VYEQRRRFPEAKTKKKKNRKRAQWFAPSACVWTLDKNIQALPNERFDFGVVASAHT